MVKQLLFANSSYDEAFQAFLMKHSSISDAEPFMSPKLRPGALGNRLLPVKWQDSWNVYFKTA